jgi:hypothetical protein
MTGPQPETHVATRAPESPRTVPASDDSAPPPATAHGQPGGRPAPVPAEAMEALHARIAALLGPRRKQLTEAVMAEIEQQALDQMAEHFLNETRIRSMDFRNGASMDIEPARELVAHWVGAARAMLGDAPNYSETEIDFGREDPSGYEMEIKLAGELDGYVFRVQRRGKLTPHQARKLAEDRADSAMAKLDAITELCLERADRVRAIEILAIVDGSDGGGHA